jgi:TonB family protein
VPATHALPSPTVADSSTAKRGPIAAALIVAALLVAVIFFYSRKGGSTPAPPVATGQPATQAAPTQPAPVTHAAPAPATTPRATSTPPVSAPAVHPAAAPATKATAPGGDVVHKVLPAVSPSARQTITGTIKVAVRVDVDPSGKVTTAKLTNPGPSKYFARLAVEAAQKWEFSPPQVNGQPAASAWTLRFRFRRTSTEATPEPIRR